MTIEQAWKEAPQTASAEDSTAKVTYFVTDVADENAALNDLINNAPATLGNMTIGQYEIASRVGEDKWVGVVNYTLKDSPEFKAKELDGSAGAANAQVFNFNTGQQTVNLKQAVAPVARYGPAGLNDAKDYKGAINVTQNGVQGVDIVVPTYDFSLTHYLDQSIVDDNYKANIKDAAGKVNNATYLGHGQRELLFMGASGSVKGADEYEVTYRWMYSPTKTNITIDNITVAEKKGWDYLWVDYKEDDDPVLNARVQVPVGAYVDQVYEETDMSKIGTNNP